MVDAGAEGTTLEFTSTWVVAVVCSAIVLISLLVHRFLQCAGQLLSRPSTKGPKASKGRRKHLFDALQKIKEELMLLGFISLLLSVFQTTIGKICISERLAHVWLPCHPPNNSSSTTTAHFSAHPVASDGHQGRRLLADTTDYCSQKGKVPLLSLTALHHLHIFIFVLATFHMIVCVVIILCGEAKLRHWRQWDKSIVKEEQYIDENDRRSEVARLANKDGPFFAGVRRLAIIGWLHIFFKHFFPSVTKLEYIAIRLNSIKDRDLKNPKDDFQEYIRGSVQKDFDKVVGISWYLWLFAVLFLLLNVAGWNAYFWISFLPLTLLLVVSAKLEHVVTQKTKKITEKYKSTATASTSTVTVEFSDKDFWFHWPHLVLDLIHIILFQNSFELAFFFFILFQYGFNSCIMGEIGYVIPRLVIGVSVLFMCSYRTLPLYAIMKSQMNTKQDRSKEEREMKVVTWIWDWIERDSRKVATNTESTQAGTREGLAENEQTNAVEIEPEMEADIEAQDGTKPAYT